MAKTLTTPAIVLRRSNTGEADRIVTLLTRERGKIVCVAKGVRKLNSSKRAYLEPGNQVKAFLVETKSLPLLTQASLLSSVDNCHSDLKKMRQLSQVLEIVNLLCVEETEPHLFDQVATILEIINSQVTNVRAVRQQLELLIAELGYARPSGTHHTSIMEYVASLVDKPIRSWEYLQVQSR